MKKYITKQSNIKGAGKGLFTKAPFKKGEVIGLAHVDGQPTIEIGKNHNHNEKTPTANNVKNGNKRYLVASRNLQPGEEITTNYRLQPELEQPEDFKKKKGGNMTPQKDGYRTYSPFKKLPYIDVESDTIDSNNIVYDLNLQADNGLTKFVGKNTGLHTLPGAKVIREIPVKRKGGLSSLPTDKPEKSKKFSRSLDATNRLFTKNYLFEKPKSRKNKIFDPHAKYYAEGGEYEEAELTPEEIEAYRAEGYTVDDNEYQDGDDTDAMNGMMKARLAYANEFGNPAAKRMINLPDTPYQFDNGDTGTHYMASMDNYAVPQIQDENGELQLGDYGPESNEAIRFDSDEDANYFAEHYKDVSPGFINEKKEGGASSCPKDHVWDADTKKCVKVYTLANDQKFIDGVGNWAMQSNDPDKISPEYNDQIKHYLYSGKYGYDPVSGTLYPLKKEQKTVADAETKKILAKQEDKAAYRQSIIDAGFDPKTFGKSKGTNVITGEEIYGDKSQEDVDKINKEAVNDFVTEGHKQAILESPFNAAAFFTPTGMAAGVMQGAANLLPDTYNFGKDPSWRNAGAIGMDALMMSPAAKGLGKFLGYKGIPKELPGSPNAASSVDDVVTQLRNELSKEGIISQQKTLNLPWKEPIRKTIKPWNYDLKEKIADIKTLFKDSKNSEYFDIDNAYENYVKFQKNDGSITPLTKAEYTKGIKKAMDKTRFMKSQRDVINHRFDNRFAEKSGAGPTYGFGQDAGANVDLVKNRWTTWDMYLGKPQTQHPMYDISELTKSKKDVIYTIKEDFIGKEEVGDRLNDYIHEIENLEKGTWARGMGRGAGEASSITKKDGSWIIPDTDSGMFGTMGGFHWKVEKMPDGNYKAIANDVWDLQPLKNQKIGKYDTLSGKILDKVIKPIKNIEVGKALGIGKPLNVKVGFIVDGKTRKIINTFGLAPVIGTGVALGATKKQYGGLHKLQGGGSLPPKVGVSYLPKGERSYYDPIMDNISLDLNASEGELNHEMAHAWQNRQNGFRSDPYSPKLRPSAAASDEQAATYFNRKGDDVDRYINNLNTIVPELGGHTWNKDIDTFMPDQIKYDKVIDPLMYSDPDTLEGEAEYMAQVYGRPPLEIRKYGGLHKFIEGGPNNCPNDMIWDAELQDCIINAPINPDSEPITTYQFESLTPEQIVAKDAENLEKEQETWTDAQWDAYEKAEEVKVKAEAKIKAEEAYNKALINEPQYADEALNFVKGWHDSPMYNQMVLNSYKGNQKNADYLTKLRKKNIATIPAINIMANQEDATGTALESSNVAALSKSDTGQVEVFPAGFEYGPSLYAHEYMHSSDRPRELYDYDHPSYADGNSPDWMFYNDQRFPDDGWVMHGRVMPKSDQMYITTNRSSNWKDNENYKLEKEEGKYVPKTDEELKQEVIDSGFSLDDPLFKEKFNAAKKQNIEDIKWSQNWNKEHWKEFGHDYVSDPTETRARLGEIRLHAKKENIYDPYTEQITPEIFQNYINKKREDGNVTPMKPIDELRNEFTDEEILYMLQNISKNPNPQKEEEGAEGVMKYGGLHKFAGGAEVESPCPKGYIFDTKFKKCVPEMQYRMLNKSSNSEKAIIENEKYRKANDYLIAYYASPKYKEMLKRSSSSPENYNYIFKERNKQLANTPPLLLLPQPEDQPNVGGQSMPSTGQITVFPQGYGTAGTAVHELSHSSDRGKLIPESDKKYINLHKAKVLGDSRDYQNDKEIYNYENAQKDFQKFYTNYVGKDTETRARLNAIRQGAKENGLYDPFTQGVSRDLYYKKLKNFKFEKGNKSAFDPMQQLKGTYSDEEIIWMLNNISKNDNKQEEEIVEGKAKKGGYIDLELTPEEIERYRRGGFIVEEIY